MRGAPLYRDEPSLEDHLAQLDVQLQRFEASLRAQQQSHGRTRELELELAAVIERGSAVVRELTTIRDQVHQAAEAATREGLAASVQRVQDFEQRGARILEAYGNAIRAAQQAVARAEARIDAFDERVARELAQASREIREAASLLNDRIAKQIANVPPAPLSRRLMPVLLAALLLLSGLLAYGLVARALRDASARADAAERQAQEVRREASQRIEAIERGSRQTSAEAVATAARTERMIRVLAAADSRRLPLFGQRRAPYASGEVLWSPSRGVVITAAGLPTLPANATYQVWLVTPDGSVSLGTSSPDAQGRMSLHFDLPAGFLGTPRGFMLTQESAGGSPRPSRTVVLAS